MDHYADTSPRQNVEESKSRRFEAAVRVRRRRPDGRPTGGPESKRQTAHDQVLLVSSIPDLPDPQSAWRRTHMSRVPLAGWRPRGFPAFVSSFDSSILPFFDANRGYVPARQ